MNDYMVSLWLGPLSSGLLAVTLTWICLLLAFILGFGDTSLVGLGHFEFPVISISKPFPLVVLFSRLITLGYFELFIRSPEMSKYIFRYCLYTVEAGSIYS